MESSGRNSRGIGPIDVSSLLAKSLAVWLTSLLLMIRVELDRLIRKLKHKNSTSLSRILPTSY
jgi:hypothetical protein